MCTGKSVSLGVLVLHELGVKPFMKLFRGDPSRTLGVFRYPAFPPFDPGFDLLGHCFVPFIFLVGEGLIVGLIGRLGGLIGRLRGLPSSVSSPLVLIGRGTLEFARNPALGGHLGSLFLDEFDVVHLVYFAFVGVRFPGVVRLGGSV